MYFLHIIKRFVRIYLLYKTNNKNGLFLVGRSAVKTACQAGTADKEREIMQNNRLSRIGRYLMFDLHCAITSLYFQPRYRAFRPIGYPLSPSSGSKIRVSILQWKAGSTLLAR